MTENASTTVHSFIDMPLNDIKPFIIANVNLQLTKQSTARMSIVGSPGCGKSEILRQICEEQGWGLAVKYLSNMSMEQITGIPCKVTSGEKAMWTKPEIFNFDELDYRPKNYEIGKTVTILLIDDFHLADKIIQKYLFQLLTYKSLNGYRLPENTAILMAGNKITDKALAHSIPAPVMNRISVYEVHADPKDWIKNYAFTHDVRHDVISFINDRGGSFLCQTPIESTPWASPRSWTFLSEQMDAYEKCFGSLPIDKLNIIASGLIGSEYASEFIAYREIFSKWDIGALRKKKMEAIMKEFTDAINKNAVNAYGIINASIAWMLNVWKENDYDANKKELQEATKFVYDIMSGLLGVKCHNVQIKPLVISGTHYMWLFNEAQKNNYKIDEKLSKCRTLYLKNFLQKRDIDWLYYEIIANIFGLELDAEDIKAIKKAKEAIK